MEHFTRDSLYENLFYEYMLSKDCTCFTHNQESSEYIDFYLAFLIMFGRSAGLRSNTATLIILLQQHQHQQPPPAC